MKKFTSILLCLCMILSLALPVCAEETGKPVYVVLGDEIASGKGLEDAPSFGQIIADAMDYELVNLAKDGTTGTTLLEQLGNDDVIADIARADVITITCGFNDILNLVFHKTAENYNAANDPDITADEVQGILENSEDPRFRKLAAAAMTVFIGNQLDGIPPYMETEEFAAEMEAFNITSDAIMSAVVAINPDANVIVTNMYNPYRNFTGLFASLAVTFDNALIDLNAAMVEKGYQAADVYTAFVNSTEDLCNSSSAPMSMDFTPNAAGHSVIAKTVLRMLPDYTPFVDVAQKDWFFDPVLWAVDNGITAGMGGGKFAPGDPCTRGQVVTFLWRAAGCPEPTTTQNPFSDVAEKDYFYKPVLWAVENGITAGMSATTFGPSNPCTRGQVVTFLWRAAGKPESTTENSFSDVAEKDYFYVPVLWAVENGITAGMGGGKFAPGNTCTRGQVVTFLYRAATN